MNMVRLLRVRVHLQIVIIIIVIRIFVESTPRRAGRGFVIAIRIFLSTLGRIGDGCVSDGRVESRENHAILHISPNSRHVS